MFGLFWFWILRKLLLFCKILELCFKLKIVDKGLFCIVLIGGLIGCCMLLIVLDDVGIFGVVWEWIIELFKFNRCWIFGILFLEDICEFLSLG